MRVLLATGEHRGRKDQKTAPLIFVKPASPQKYIFNYRAILSLSSPPNRNTQMVPQTLPEQQERWSPRQPRNHVFWGKKQHHPEKLTCYRDFSNCHLEFGGERTYLEVQHNSGQPIVLLILFCAHLQIEFFLWCCS